MLKTLKQVFLFILDLGLCTLLSLILIIPWLFIRVYKLTLIPIAKYCYGLQLLPFDGLNGLDQVEICVDKLHIVSNVKNPPGEVRLNKVHTGAHGGSGESEYLEESLAKAQTAAEPSEEITLCSNIALSIKYKGPSIELSEIQQLIKDKLLNPTSGLKFLNLQVKFVKFGGYLFKQKLESLDLTLNVYEVNLNVSQVVEDFYAAWLVKPYEIERPLWEIVSIKARSKDAMEDAEEDYYLAMKMHHGLGDGQTATHILNVLLGNSTENGHATSGVGSTSCITRSATPPGPASSSFLQNLILRIRTPRTLYNFDQRLNSVAKQIPLKVADVYNFQQYLSFGTLELNKLKTIKKRTGVTFQCILHTLLTESLRQLYKYKNLDIPESTFLFGTLPVPSHPFQQRMCNWAAGLWLEVPLTKLNPLERLIQIDKNYQIFHKAGLHRIVSSGLARVENLIPLLATQAKEGSPCQASWSAVVMDNHQQLLGRKIQSIHPMGGLGWFGMALTGFSMSHSNQLDFTFHGSRQIFTSRKELQKFTIDIEKQLEIMYSICCNCSGNNNDNNGSSADSNLILPYYYKDIDDNLNTILVT